MNPKLTQILFNTNGGKLALDKVLQKRLGEAKL